MKIELAGTDGPATRYGLSISASNVVVRGLAFNRFYEAGLRIGAGAGSNRREGNFIGTDPSGAVDVTDGGGAGVGVRDAKNNTIGGTSPGARNLISGNGLGVFIASFPASSTLPSPVASGNKVLGNLIGTQKDGASPLGNTQGGVRLLEKSIDNTVGGAFGAENIIAHNGREGVLVSEYFDPVFPSGNRILGNSIFSNGSLGVDLGGDGRTANDSRDRDKGANSLQNFPVLSSATANPDGTGTITGTLESTPRKSFTIQFFYNFEGEDEGRWLIGEKKVKTNHKGKASFTRRPQRSRRRGEDHPVGLGLTEHYRSGDHRWL